jgi:hypothetical protein
MVKIPIGTLSRNTHRQLAASTSTAPSVGPSAPATAPVAPQTATATGIFPGGNARRTSASDDGMSTAPPTAWTTRKAISTPALGATAHRTEATVNRAEPARKARLCPIRSASLPTGTSNAANTIV